MLLSSAATATASRAQEEPAPGARIAEVVRRAAGFGYSGAVLVARDGKVLYVGAAGLADRERGIPNTTATLFSIGSMTKQFTAVAILQLEERGRLSVTDPIAKVLPGVPPDKAAITIHQLLSHTSGLPTAWHDQFDPTPAVTRDELVARVLALPLAAPPGKAFLYSNAGYQLLAAIVELRAETGYWDYLHEHVLVPARMEHARTPRDVGPTDALALGYEGERVAAGLAEARASTWLPAGDNGLLCSVLDLQRWFEALGGGAVLSPDATEKMLTPGLESYGYGVWIRPTKRATRAVLHGGDMWGYGAEALWYLDEDALVIATSNDRPNYTQYYRAITQGSVPEILFGVRESAPLPDFVARPPEELAALAGTYSLPSGDSLALSWLNGRLRVVADGQEAIDALVEQKETPEALAVFRRDALAVIEGFYRGERARLDALLAPGVYDGDPARVANELRGFTERRGPFRAARVLGTAPGFYAPHSTTFLELDFERGRERFQITWQDGAIWWTDANVLGPAFWNLQMESAGRLVGYDLATRRALRLEIGEDALTVRRDGGKTFVRRK